MDFYNKISDVKLRPYLFWNRWFHECSNLLDLTFNILLETTAQNVSN